MTVQDHPAMLPHHAHGAKDRCVVDHDRIRIRHEHLEAGDTLVADRMSHVGQRAVVDVGGDDMKAVVDGGGVLRLGLCRPPLRPARPAPCI